MLYLLLLFLGFVAWFISTVSAGGAVSLLMPILAILIGSQLVAPVVTLAALTANPSRAWMFRHYIDWKIANRMMFGSLIGAVLGALIFVRLPIEAIKLILAIFLMSTVLQYRFGRIKQSFNMPLWGFTPLGFVVAFISGVVGGSGPIHNPFLLNAGLEKEYLIGTKAMNSLAMQLFKLLAYGALGALSFDSIKYGLVIGIGGAFSVFYAKKYLQNIQHQQFQQYTLWMMFIAGFAMLLQTIHEHFS